MADLGFPTNPNVGDTWVVGTKTYQWNGTAWIVVQQSSSLTNLIVETLIVNSTTNINTGLGYINGPLQVYGGAWVEKDLYVGGSFYSAGQQVLTTSSFAGQVTGGVDIEVISTVGTDSTTILTWNNVSTLQTVTGRGATTNKIVYFTTTTESTATNNGAVVISGGLGVAKRVNCESLRIADAVFDSTQTLVNTTATTAIDTYSITQFRSAKYLIQIDEGTGAGADFELREILLVADNSSNVWATEYGVVTSNGDLGTFAAEMTGTTVTLYFTAHSVSSKTVKVLRTGMAV
jgi:hypothetical protein